MRSGERKREREGGKDNGNEDGDGDELNRVRKSKRDQICQDRKWRILVRVTREPVSLTFDPLLVFSSLEQLRDYQCGTGTAPTLTRPD